MRPRVFPAEDRHDRPADRARLPGFNEAAGIPRGRRVKGGKIDVDLEALQ